MLGDALEPHDAGLVVLVFDRAARLHELVGAHRGVADEDRFPVGAVLVQHVPCRHALVAPARVVAPDVVVRAVVEIKVLEMAKLRLGRREELFAHADVRVHRAPDIEEQEHLHSIAPFGNEMQIQVAGVLCRAGNRAVHVELFRNAFACEATEPPQRDLDVARVELDVAVEVAERALVPDLDRAAVAAAFLADPDAFGVVAVGAERTCAAGADPFVAARVPSLLLLEPFLQGLHELVPAAERFDLRLVFVGQEPLEFLAQPLLRNPGADVEDRLDALEVEREGEVVAVELRLVLDQRARARGSRNRRATAKPLAPRALRAASGTRASRPEPRGLR
jgi:hypothetical protein